MNIFSANLEVLYKQSEPKSKKLQYFWYDAQNKNYLSVLSIVSMLKKMTREYSHYKQQQYQKPKATLK